MPWLALVGPEIEENLSLRHLASSLGRAAFDCEILPFNAPEQLAAVLDAVLARPESPLAVALSLAFQWRALDFLALALGLRERGYRGHVTAGGHFGTFAAAELLRDFPQLDSLCRHESEELVVELALALRDGKPLTGIRGLAARDSAGAVALAPLRSPPDLATLPWPDRRGEAARCLGHGIAAMVSSRGCYARCAFCCIAAWHEQTLPGKRFRLRPVEDVAREMAWLQAEKGRDVFIFHDDNFFLPRPQDSLERVHALADAVERLGMGRFATVVKARPNDATEDVFRAMRDRLGCVRVFLGVESDSGQGLATLGRKIVSEQNHAALEVMTARLGLYVCFNLLVFDPDTTLTTLEENLRFMEQFGENPFNFGRVELYAGTPLLERMQAERRCTGDYLGWDYRLADPEIQRTFELSMEAFHERNFSGRSLANHLMGTRFDVEIARHFHPDRYVPQWRDRALELNRRLSRDSVAGLREIVAFVREKGPQAPAGAFVADLSRRLRGAERAIAADAASLERAIRERVMGTPGAAEGL